MRSATIGLCTRGAFAFARGLRGRAANGGWKSFDGAWSVREGLFEQDRRSIEGERGKTWAGIASTLPLSSTCRVIVVELHLAQVREPPTPPGSIEEFADTGWRARRGVS